MKPVTDPALLAELEGNTASKPKPVSDPALLAELNGTAPPRQVRPETTAAIKALPLMPTGDRVAQPTQPAGNGFVPGKFVSQGGLVDAVAPKTVIERYDLDTRVPLSSLLPPVETPRAQYFLENDRSVAAPSMGGSFVRALPRGVLPSGASIAGFGAGASLVSPLAPFAGPAAPVVPLAGGLIGAFTAGGATNYLQEMLLDALPTDITSVIGQDAATRNMDRQANPYTTMIGEMLPGFGFARPGFSGLRVPEGSSPTVSRILANPAAQPAVGASIGGVSSVAAQLATEGEVDPKKVAISAGFGALQTKNTRLGDVFSGAGTRAGDYFAGMAGWQRQAAEDMAGRFEQSNGDNKNFYDSSAPPVPEPPAGGFTDIAHPEGPLMSADGETPVRFATHREAAAYAAKNGLGGDYDIAIVENGLVLKRRNINAAAAPEQNPTAQDTGEPQAAPESAPVAPQPPSFPRAAGAPSSVQTGLAAVVSGAEPAAPAAPSVDLPSTPHPLGTSYTLPDGNSMVVGQTEDGNWSIMFQNPSRDEIGGADNIAGPDKTEAEVVQIALAQLASGEIAIQPERAASADPASLPIDENVLPHLAEQARTNTPSYMAALEAEARQIAANEGAASVSSLHFAQALNNAASRMAGQNVPQGGDALAKPAEPAPANGRETIDVTNDTPLGVNAAGDQIFQRADGQIYRMRNGKPDFGGDLATVEQVAPSQVNSPEIESALDEIDIIDQELSRIAEERAENAYEGEDPDTKADYEEQIAALNARRAELENIVGGQSGAPAKVKAAEQAPLAPPVQVGKKTAARLPTKVGKKINFQFELHDMSNLRYAEGDLQNRDRTRADTQDFLRGFVKDFDPEVLGEDKFTDRGAPIINKDNVVLSGNGRTLGLEEIYDNHPELAEAYRQFLRDEGYNIDGVERPVLTRRVLGDIDERQFVTGSNDSDKNALSAPELARQDARDVLTNDVLSKFKGGDITARKNDDFVSAFLTKLSDTQRRSIMDDRGKISTLGITRINNALLARAYGGAGEISNTFISKAMERTDDDSKTLTNALIQVAPNWIEFQNAIAAGEVDPKYNITEKLLEAIATVADIRQRGFKVGYYLRMEDMVSPMDAFVKDILLSFHNDTVSAFKSSAKIGKILRDYTAKAELQQAGEDMFGAPMETPSPHQIWRAVDRETLSGPDDEEQGQGALLDKGTPNDTQGKNGRRKGRSKGAALEDALEGEGGELEAGSGGEVLNGWSGWTPDRLKTLLRTYGYSMDDGRTKAMAVMMSPKEFLDLTAPGETRAQIQEEAGDLNQEKLRGEDQPIYLRVEETELGLSTIGHEGRHRMAALAKAGVEYVPVVLDFGNGKTREPIDSIYISPQRFDDGVMGDRGAYAVNLVPISYKYEGTLREDFSIQRPVKGVVSFDRSGISADNKGGYADGFIEASFTNRVSIYNSAVRSLGMDPDQFRLLKPERQLTLLQRALQQLTGIEVTVDKRMNLRPAIDQLLDAHATMQGMAYVLGISPRALSLEGKLKLELRGKAGFLGAFYPDENKITLPGRSNSWAHEWSHALDWFLLGEFGTDPTGKGISGSVRQLGVDKAADQAPANLKEAFVDLMNAMFFDKADMAAKIMDLEKKIAASKSAKQKAALQAQIDNFKAGRSQAKDVRSNFYKGAASFDGAGGDYWTSPTEMMARAMEAYVSYMAELEGFGTEFIGKGDANYLANPQERFAKTFPKDEERNRIFDALGELFRHLNNDMVLEASNGSKPDIMNDVSKLSDFDRLVETVENGGIMQRQMDEIRRWARRRARELEGRINDQKTLFQWMQDIAALSLYSMGGKLEMLHARYQSKAIQEILDHLITSPGSGRRVGETFFEEVEGHTNKTLNRLDNILKAAGLEHRDEVQDRMLRDALISEDTSAMPIEIEQAAAAIRRLLDEEFYRNTSVGIKLGYARGVGYLPRILDVGRVLYNQDGFVADATKVYEIVFDRDFGADADEVMGADDGFEKLTKLARSYAKNKLNADGDVVNGKNDAIAANLLEIRKLQREIKRLERAQDTSDDPDAIEAKLAELNEKLLDLVGELHELVRAEFADRSAKAWMFKIQSAADYDFDAHSPDSTYTKSRELPPETDKIMENHYLQDPVEAVTKYIQMSARRTAYARRFGADNSKRNALINRMTKEGVINEDVQEVIRVLNIATGRVSTSIGRSAQRFLSFISALGTMTLLPRAVLSSLPEAVAAAMAGNDVRLGIKAFAAVLVGTKSMNGKQRKELAQAMGIVLGAGGDHIIAERFGGTYGNVTRFDRMTQKMFINTGLHALTRAQRTHVLAAGHAFLDNLAGRVLEGDKDAIAMLQELGVRDPEAFANEMKAKGDMPDVEDLGTAWGEDYALAQRRFADMTIQNPNPMVRPQLANNPAGRIIYGIMSFSMSFWRNVIRRQLVLTKGIYQRGGGGKAGAGRAAKHWAIGVLPAAMLMLGMGIVNSTMREYLLNRTRWKELEKDGELVTTMLKLGANRTFALGILDPFISGYAGLRYQRDLSNMMIGPAPGYIFQNIQTMLQAPQRNSDKTNTTEYNAARAAYNISIAPAASMGLSLIPGGPLLGPAAGFGQAYLTSPQAGNEFAKAITGPKGAKTDPETGDVIETRDEYQSRRDQAVERRLERERAASEE